MKEVSLDRTSTLTDLDPRRQTEPTKIATETYRNLLQQAGDGFLVVSESGNILDINVKACELLGFEQEELFGRPMDEIVPPELRSRKVELFERLQREQSCLLELPLLKSDGDSVWVELNASRIVSRGAVLYSGAFRDVSVRRQMEKETRRRNKELFVLNSIARVISRLLDPQEVLTSGLEKVLSLLDIEGGYILLLNEESGELEMAVHRGLSAEFVQEYSCRPLKVGEGITGQTFLSGKPIHSRDASTDPRVTRSVVRKDRLRSSLNIPLKAKERVLGVLMVVSIGIREFSDWDIEILTTIGHEMGVSLENSRLYRDVEQRSREVSSLLHLSNELNRRMDLKGLLSLVTEKARELVPCGAVSTAFVENGGLICCTLSDRTGNRASWSRRPMLPDNHVVVGPPFDRAPLLGGVNRPRDVLAVPIEDGHGKTTGLIELYDSKGVHGFTRKHAEFISALAAQASIAFEKSRLFEETEREVEFVANIVNNMASGLLVTDNTGRIQRINRRAEEMIGARQHQLRGRLLEDWLEDAGKLLDPSQLPCSVETELRTFDGRTVPVKLAGSLQVDDAGRPLGVIFILEDLERIRFLENKEQEREHLAAIGELAAGIAHEIRNPLFGISSVAQILKMEATTKDEHHPLMDAMMGEIERINRMVEELLFYGRPYSLNLSKVDLRAIWRSIILLASSEIETRRLTVETEFCPETPFIIADAERLRQVFLNLLKNAIDATPPLGEIRVRLEPHAEEKAVGIEVKDTGGGIASETLPKIFELFYSEKKGGSGLGLPICRKIVEGHGGRIEVESRPGEGSIFKIWLPSHPPQGTTN